MLLKNNNKPPKIFKKNVCDRQINTQVDFYILSKSSFYAFCLNYLPYSLQKVVVTVFFLCCCCSHKKNIFKLSKCYT